MAQKGIAYLPFDLRRKKNPGVRTHADPEFLGGVAGTLVPYATEANLQTVVKDLLLSHTKCQGDL